MINKLSYRFSAAVLFILVSLTVVFVPVFLYFQETMFINYEKERMQTFADGMYNILTENDAGVIQNYIKENEAEDYRIRIRYEDGHYLYNNENNDENIKNYGGSDNKDKNDPHHFRSSLYTEDAQPVATPQREGVGFNRMIELRKLYEENGETYYVYVRESLRSIDALFSYTNRMTLYILILFMAVCFIALLILTRSIRKPIIELSEVTRKVAEEDYSARYSGQIRRDEIGDLARNVNHMVDAIQENITELNNYNFLLNDRIEDLNEREKLRNKMITQLIHELKTPLTIISTQVEMINGLEDGEKKQEYFDRTMEEIRKMSSTITDELSTFAYEKDIFRGQPEQLDLTGFVSNLCEEVRNYVESHGIKFGADLEPGCTKYICAEHVEHIFHNYMGNAVKHGKEKGQIYVNLFGMGDKVRLSVYNTGDQIPDQNEEKIWLEFESINKGRAKKGAGLGLYIVKEISLLYHTDCGFTNLRNGVEFWFDFVDFSEEKKQ